MSVNEIWTLRKQDKHRLTTSEIKFFRRRAGYTVMDHKKSEEILQELRMTSILERIKKYKENWLQRISRMDPDRLPQKFNNTNLKEKEEQGYYKNICWMTFSFRPKRTTRSKNS
jgi:hypothetical protein